MPRWRELVSVGQLPRHQGTGMGSNVFENQDASGTGSTGVGSSEASLAGLVCPACGGRQWHPIPGTQGGDYARCQRCRYHVRLVQTEHERAETFEQEQQKFYGDDSFCMTQLFEELQARRVRKRIEVVTRYLKSGRLIEVGPGNGEVLARLAQLGFQVTGVEHSATMSALIQERYGIDVRVGSFEDHSFEGELFDAYLSFHVIEHVTDVPAHLKQAASIVRPGGYAFIATPNADSWEHRISHSLSPNFSPVHLQLFSCGGMTGLLDRAGFELIDLVTPSYTDAWLRVVSSCYRRLRGKRGRSGDMVTRSNTPLRRTIIKGLSVVDFPLRTVQEWLRGGNELFVVGRRVVG